MSPYTAKVPYLPSDDYDFDHAVSELRIAVGEIDADAAVSSVLRILRHRRDLAAQVLEKQEPTCRSCGGDRKCLGCDDVRPEAEKLDKGWQFVSPLGRWETVNRVDQANEYAPVRVWTAETGPDYSWLMPRYRKLNAVAPPWNWHGHGTPEIRIVEHSFGRDAPMYAVTTLDTIYRPHVEDYIAEARYTREGGWKVTHRPDGGGEVVVVDCGRSKAKARTALRAAARQHAKALNVKVAVEGAR